MTRNRALYWTRTAQTLSRAGLLWLALTAVALGSLVSSGAGLAPSARLIAASSIGSTGKLKANGPGAPTVIPGELIRRAQEPDAEAKRVHATQTPFALIKTDFVVSYPVHSERLPATTEVDEPVLSPSAFSARAPPVLA